MIPYLIALSIIIWLFLSPSGTQQDSAPTKKRKSNAPAVVATAVTIDTLIATHEALGTGAGLTEVKIAAQTEGILRDVPVRVGASVTKGQRLAYQNDEILRIELEQAEAALVRSEDQLRRVEQLAAKKLADQNRLQAAVAQHRIDTAAVRKARTMLALGEHRSPIDGVITAQILQSGDTVQPGSHIVTVTDVSRILVFAKVPEEVAMRLHAGDSVQLEAPSVGASSLSATVLRVHPSADPISHQVVVELDAGTVFPRLKPGFQVTARFTTAARRNVVVLDRRAVAGIFKSGPAEVMVVREGRAETRAVELGLVLDDRAEVLKGLAKGDRVIIQGADAVRDGGEVSVVGDGNER